MKRLTYFEHGKNRLMFDGVEYSNEFVDRLAAYEDKIPFDRLDEAAALVKVRDEGRVVVLPCKVGDTVWTTQTAFTKYAEPRAETVIGFSYPWHDPSGDLLLVCCKGGRKFTADRIGDTVFLTRAGAEAALGGGGDGL